MKVLVVDDSESIRELVGMTLESEGYQVHKSADGVEALDHLTSTEVDLVITDLNMPNMDGISLVREIRKDDAKTGLPVLLLTTESQVAKKDEARQAGATGWIVKPFAQDRLLAVVKKILR
ncbi:MAG: response regulator [Cytophagales bacterium]|nr:response regulator [Cytophagales bacterium]